MLTIGMTISECLCLTSVSSSPPASRLTLSARAVIQDLRSAGTSWSPERPVKYKEKSTH